MNPLPIQGAKVHRPPVRDDVLSRDRLNAWLDRAAEGRLALIVAEAGFGKTTLLADWSQRTLRLTAWYSLEPDDRDWLTFIRHIVGSGRELDPDFAVDTFSLLQQLGPGGPTQADLVASLARELGEFGATHPHGLSLVLDDYHVIDGSDETDPIVRAILGRTGPGFSVVIATRAVPKLPLSRLRAHGGVARLEGRALCFDTAEADRLFRDRYHQPLDHDILVDLIDRTEGWPALLSLVRTSLEERGLDDGVNLVRELNAAKGDMFDFLAEEVVDRLSPELATFLIRVSILDEVDVAAAGVVVESGTDDVHRLMGEASQLRLLSRPDPGTSPRLAPLLQEFLAARLRIELGAGAVRELHHRLGLHFRGSRWRTSASHFARAGESESAAEVIEASLDEILGRGEYRAAMDLIASPSRRSAVREVLRSRLLLQVGSVQEALTAAQRAVELAEAESYTHAHVAYQNAASIATAARLYEDALTLAGMARSVAPDEVSRELADGYVTLIAASASASLPTAALQFEAMLTRQLSNEQWHYAAITSLNLAQVLAWLDRAPDALRLAAEAERLLLVSSRGYEAISANLVRAQVLASIAQWAPAQALLGVALETGHPEGRLEAILEAASVTAWYGPPELAIGFLARARHESLPEEWAFHWKIVELSLETDPVRCQTLLSQIPESPTHSTEVGASFRWHLAVARAHMKLDQATGFAAAMSRVEEVAECQRSPLQARILSLLRSTWLRGDSLCTLVEGWSPDDDATLGVFAPELCSLLDQLSDSAVSTLIRAGRSQPQRWRSPLRSVMSGVEDERAMAAATVLENVGLAEDIPLLRDFSRRTRRSGRAWGDALIRRVAPRVSIDDLGLMSITVGERMIDGRGIRRKVLALLAFLATRPSGSATPDQVLDALWPDLDPIQGANSVHQTIYFLRRVLDPGYRAGLSAEYLHFDAEVIWLDTSLVDCRSWQSRRMLQGRPEDQASIEALLRTYRGRFAADFAYEDWAAPYRESLHASYLSVIERAVSGSIGSPDPRWRLWVGQQAIEIDPEADAIEAHVIRLYKELGAPAAAAEQYAHYSALMRDQLGVDAPDLLEM